MFLFTRTVPGAYRPLRPAAEIRQGSLTLSVVLVTSVQALTQSFQLPTPETLGARQGLPQAFVPAIVQDNQGFIWMATRDGLARYDGYSFKVFQPTTGGKTSISGTGITNVQKSPDGSLWISTDDRQLDQFDPYRETFLNFSRQPFYRRAFSRDTINGYYPDHHQHLWLLFRDHGVVRFSLKTHDYQRFTQENGKSGTLGSNSVNAVLEDGTGKVWIATRQGLDLFNEQTGTFTHFAHQPNNPRSIPENDIVRLARRKNGELWLQSRHYLTRWNPITRQATAFAVESNHPLVNQIVSDQAGNDYILVRDRVLMRYNEQEGMQRLNVPGKQHAFIDLYVDKSDVLWVGTDLNGVYKYNLHSASLSFQPYVRSFPKDVLHQFLNVPADKLPQFQPQVTDTSAYSFRSTFDRSGAFWFNVGGTPIYRVSARTTSPEIMPFPVELTDKILESPTAMATDPGGQVWVVHPNWTGYYDSEARQWVRFSHSLRTIGSIMQQAVVDRAALWIATSGRGLYRVDRRTGSIRRYGAQPQDSTSINSNNLYCLSADSRDNNYLWVGSFGQGLGLFDKRTGHCQRITTRQGLPNNVIYAALPDRRGKVWVATNKGLARYDRQTGNVQTYTDEDGLGADEFNRFHFVTMPDGRLLLGNIRGIVSLNPDHIYPDTFKPSVQLADIRVNNRSLTPGPLTNDQTVNQLSELTLPYQQNFVSVRFAAMQYNRLRHTQYRYQLQDVDAGWVLTDWPEAAYTALPPGTYLLRMQAANTSGHWSPYERQLTLTITPPWWLTGWMYAIYALVGIGFVYWLIKNQLNRLWMRQLIGWRQQEADQLREVDAMKARFITDMTHELRTPLTLIQLPAQQIRQHLNEPKQLQQNIRRLNSIDHNAQHLLDLVNQLLSLSQLEADVSPVRERRGNLTNWLRHVVDSFESMAEARDIRLLIQFSEDPAEHWFDSEKLESIVGNLLANALKYTPAWGTVSVKAEVEHDALRFAIRDTGPGIAPEQLPHIFDRFYKGKASGANGKQAPMESTGIGLALVKALVEQQGGRITASSMPGEGTTFAVWLPYRIAENRIVPAESRATASVSTNESVKVLLVEDHVELAEFIRQSLPDDYLIQWAENGAEGLQKAIDWEPDLIISDILMPVMDGLTLVEKLRQDLRISHIPVILLTAKNTTENRLRGLEAGADDYLTKPFLLVELQLRVQKLLWQRQQSRQQLQTELSQLTDPPADLPSPELPLDPFLERVYGILDKHLQDSNFGVDQLTSELSMSRMSAYRKLKTLTNMSAVDVIRTYRLKRATTMLKEGLSVGETAYQVGFDSPAYFTKLFRQAYGVTPTEFARKGGASFTK